LGSVQCSGGSVSVGSFQYVQWSVCAVVSLNGFQLTVCQSELSKLVFIRKGNDRDY
jgi:hypothetical protein